VEGLTPNTCMLGPLLYCGVLSHGEGRGCNSRGGSALWWMWSSHPRTATRGLAMPNRSTLDCAAAGAAPRGAAAARAHQPHAHCWLPQPPLDHHGNASSASAQSAPAPAPASSPQVHPVVSRLCAPIEGTDPMRIAECLGLDSSRFKGAAAAAGACAARGDDC